MELPVDPGPIDDLWARIPACRLAYDPCEMMPAEFETCGAGARTLRTFVTSYHDLDGAIRDPVVPDPDARPADSLARRTA
jgi:hypothetical protein